MDEIDEDDSQLKIDEDQLRYLWKKMVEKDEE